MVPLLISSAIRRSPQFAAAHHCNLQQHWRGAGSRPPTDWFAEQSRFYSQLRLYPASCAETPHSTTTLYSKTLVFCCLKIVSWGVMASRGFVHRLSQLSPRLSGRPSKSVECPLANLFAVILFGGVNVCLWALARGSGSLLDREGARSLEQGTGSKFGCGSELSCDDPGG